METHEINRLQFKPTFIVYMVLVIMIVGSVYLIMNTENISYVDKDYYFSYNLPSNIELVLNCTLPNLRVVTNYKVKEAPITEDEVKQFGLQFTTINTNNIDKYDEKEYSIIDSGELLTMRGKNHILYTKTGKKRVLGNWTEEGLIMLAEDYKERIMEWLPDSIIDVKFDKIKSGVISISEGVKTIRSLRVRYSLWIDGYEIFGNGAELYFEICSDEVHSFEAHYPVLYQAGKIPITITPQGAINQFLKKLKNPGYSGKGFPKGTIKTVIQNVELKYHYNFLSDTDIHPRPVYYIEGNHVITNDEGSIECKDFIDYIYATS